MVYALGRRSVKSIVLWLARPFRSEDSVRKEEVKAKGNKDVKERM
jgi:hypothetical protein